MKRIWIIWFLAGANTVFAQSDWEGKFEQLGPVLPTPNEYRTASGMPGQNYWQQKADYKIQVTLDDVNQEISGQAGITYTNNSPHQLPYLWLQLDQNLRNEIADSRTTRTGKMAKHLSPLDFQLIRKLDTEVDGYKIEWVRSGSGAPLDYVINKTMMRVDLPKPLQPGQSVVVWVGWNYKINNRLIGSGRSGYEYFPEDDNYLYTIAQFYPRMAVYSDYQGWQNKQFLGESEFSTNFGDFQVDITVPEDMIVAATGTLVNTAEVLTKSQLDRLEKSKSTYDKPVLIVTAAEAKRNEPSRSGKVKRWHFDANNVRDFAFVASRKFVWDAMAVDVGEKDILAMSLYTKESNQLWKNNATKVSAHTLKFLSNYLFEYPYPVAISVNTASLGMEYPMINFSYGRPVENEKVSDRDLNAMTSVIIHEVAHNYFPLIVNSDERALYWMDEGIISYLQYLIEQDWTWGYPSRRGPSAKVIPYMDGTYGDFRPIMSDPEQHISNYGNSYLRPATAFNILRNLVMGPELFDKALKTYANTWKFKHPTYADFFRIMEDASAVDLDWFWRAWFYSTDHVDVSIKSIKCFKLSDKDPIGISMDLNEINDSPYPVNYKSPYYAEFRDRLDDEAYKSIMASVNFYEVTFENIGGLVSPLVLEWKYADMTTEKEIIPAEVWRLNENQATKIFVKEKKVIGLELDPDQMTGDISTKNNIFPLVSP